jgi:Lysine-specific metallo-endopeptidase
MSAIKRKCGACGKESFAELNYLSLCKKCSTDSDALSRLRVRTVPPPEHLFKVPNETSFDRGMAQSPGNPAVFVVEYGDNRQVAAKHNKNIRQWCADPQQLRKFVTAAKQMVAAAAAGFAADGVHKITWFGAESGDRKWSTIGALITTLNNYLHNTLGTIKFACTYDAGIAAIDPTKFDATSATVTVLLDRGFCWNRFSDGEIICSIVHEFTHIICKTKDEKLGSDDQYGLTKCQALAKLHPEQAWVNADNWAYYICEFRAHTTDFASIDWKFLDAATYASRSVLGKGMGPP